MASVDAAWNVGDLVEWPDAEAARLIAAGIAEPAEIIPPAKKRERAVAPAAAEARNGGEGV